MLVIHPEKHANHNILQTVQLLKQAKLGSISLVLEDNKLAKQNNVHSLEGNHAITIDVKLGMLVFTLNSHQEYIRDLGDLGRTSFLLFVIVCFALEYDSSNEETNAVINAMKSDDYQMIKAVDFRDELQQVQEYCVATLGGIPGNLEINQLRNQTLRIVKTRSDLDPITFAIYHQLIIREQNMWTRVNKIINENLKQDIHIVIGANHVSSLLTEEQVHKMQINVETFRKLETLAEDAFPHQRLTHFLKQHNVQHRICIE
jgi:hypothetical protein